MKYKIENSHYWLVEKNIESLSSVISIHLRNHTANDTVEAIIEENLSPQEKAALMEVFDIERKYQKKVYIQHYMPSFELKNKEPFPIKPLEISDISMLKEEYHPALEKLRKTLPVFDNQYYSIINRKSLCNLIHKHIKKIKAGSKLLSDIYSKKLVVQPVSSEATIDNYMQGIKAYVCGDGNKFYNAQKSLVKLNNAQLFESLEDAKKFNYSSSVFEVELKLLSPSLTKSSKADEEINAILRKNTLEASLGYKGDAPRKNKI